VCQVRQSSVFRVLDAVLAAGALAVAGFEGGKVRCWVVGGEAGDAVTIGVGEGQLRSGGGRSFRAIMRIPAGQW
jgi:hypothetical protein